MTDRQWTELFRLIDKALSESRRVGGEKGSKIWHEADERSVGDILKQFIREVSD